MQPPQMPPQGPPQNTVRADMMIKSFISPENPTPKQLLEYDKEVNEFLKTIDNKKRFLNGRNSYSIGNKSYTLVWFLNKLADEPVTQPFGDKKVQPATPIIKNDKPTDNSKK